ncbi:unnamed protein product [Penicillium nalgiovense]|nr:unnamed protein product [Penicillium nalgiovense]
MPAYQELNRAALVEFFAQRVSRETVRYVAQQAAQVIECEAHVSKIVSQHGQRTPTSSLPVEPADQLPPLPAIEGFIASLVNHSQIQMPILMSSLVYFGRLRARLPPVTIGTRCTVHRIFLASIILPPRAWMTAVPRTSIGLGTLW